VKILSGVMAHPDTGVQVTTGTPIALLIENTDQRSKDYSDIKDKFRPGHADFTYEAKYGLRDYRGGGRSSRPPGAHRDAVTAAVARRPGSGGMRRGRITRYGASVGRARGGGGVGRSGGASSDRALANAPLTSRATASGDLVM